MYCPWCGKKMEYEKDNGEYPEDSSEWLYCKKCDTHYKYHGINGVYTRAGDSWSITYLK